MYFTLLCHSCDVERLDLINSVYAMMQRFPNWYHPNVDFVKMAGILERVQYLISYPNAKILVATSIGNW